MKSLESFVREIAGVDKERFCAFYNCPFFLSKNIEADPKENEKDDEEQLSNTEELEGLEILKFDTDKMDIEKILALQDQADDVWVIALRKKGNPPGRQMITIGRTMNNDICLPFQGISKFHSYLLVENLETALVDGESKNGTFLNARKLIHSQKYPLKSMDTVSFAKIFHYFYFTPDKLFDYLYFKKLLK